MNPVTSPITRPVSYPVFYPLGDGESIPAGILDGEIQQFSITISGLDTNQEVIINGVDPTRSMVIFSGFTTDVSDIAQNPYGMPRIALASDGGSVFVFRGASDGAATITVYGFVIQFKASAVTAVIQDVVNILNGSAGNISVAAFAVERSAIFYQGCTEVTPGLPASYSWASVFITSSGEVGAGVNSALAAGNDVMVGFTVVEFAEGVVNSLQTVQIDMDTATVSSIGITPVNLDNSLLLYNGVQAFCDDYPSLMCIGSFLDETSVGAQRFGTVSGPFPLFTVLEFSDGVINQAQRNIDFFSDFTATFTLDTVFDTTKTIINFDNQSNETRDFVGAAAVGYTLDDATHVTGYNGTAADSRLSSREVIEFI